VQLARVQEVRAHAHLQRRAAAGAAAQRRGAAIQAARVQRCCAGRV
jgi:hypothetical protein